MKIIYSWIIYISTLEKLWVPPDSRTARDKAYFDSNFGPFFRIEQLIITSKTRGEKIIQLPILNEVLEIQNTIVQLTTTVDGQLIRMSDLCYKPIPGKGCILESALEFWQVRINYKDSVFLSSSLFSTFSLLSIYVSLIYSDLISSLYPLFFSVYQNNPER